jgi:phage shock protein A
VLIAQHRRARAVGKASDARLAMGDGSKAAAFDRMKRKVAHSEAVGQAKAEIAGDNMEDRLAALEKEDRIEQLLAELKTKRGALLSIWLVAGKTKTTMMCTTTCRICTKN